MSELRMLPMVAALVVALGYFASVMVGKTRLLVLARQRPEFFSEIPTRFANMLLYAFGQRKMFKEPRAGLMHAFIFWGFLVLQLRTLYLIVIAFLPEAVIPFVHHPYALAKDVTEVVVLAMVLYAAYRRLVTRPARLTFSTEALLVLFMIGGLLVSDLLYDGFLFAEALASGADPARWAAEMRWAPVGAALSSMLGGLSHGELIVGREACYWSHIFIVLTFLNMLPGSKHFHVITSVPNTLFSEVKPKGALRNIENLMEQESFGVGEVLDFDMRQILDTYTCTECGRCAVNCPTTISEKPLNPKMLIVDIRDHLYAREDELLANAGPAPDYDGPSLIDSVGFDAIWDCTTCRACSEACPAMIEHVDKIVDMRRHLLMMESNFPKEMASTLRNLEDKGNPWGLPMGDRTSWADDLNIPTIEENPDAEYIFWVGCAGAYDDVQTRVSRALVQLLREGGVSFAWLADGEGCTGDPARRAGNEYLFQMMAEQNVAAMKARGVHRKKLVTHCPHCLNTIKNEYPQFGGVFEIVHHTQLIDRLIGEGRLKPTQTPESAGRVVYHDSCYIGRYNEVYEEPRRALTAIPGLDLQEMERNRTTGMCCGAGGARVWMEEDRGRRINEVRVEQALETQPDTIAVGCPFCKMMIRDGTKAVEAEHVKTRDIAELVLDSLGPVGENATATAAPTAEEEASMT